VKQGDEYKWQPKKDGGHLVYILSYDHDRLKTMRMHDPKE
jgi:hypothetical protein